MKDVTLVIPTFNRFENLTPILKSVGLFDFFAEIVLWNNGPAFTEAQRAVLFRASPHELLIIDSPENVQTWGRYLAADDCKTRIIATQDDDCLVPNWRRLYESVIYEEPWYVTTNLKPGHYQWGVRDGHYRHEGCCRTCWECLWGWGAMWRRELLAPVITYGRRLLEAGQRQDIFDSADRAFGILLRRQHVIYQTPVLDLPGASGTGALWKRRDHRARVRRSIELALEEERRTCEC